MKCGDFGGMKRAFCFIPPKSLFSKKWEKHWNGLLFLATATRAGRMMG